MLLPTARPEACTSPEGSLRIPVLSVQMIIHTTAARYLSLARDALGMDLAWLSEHTGPEQVMRVLDGDPRPFNLAEGDALAWEGSFCTRVLDHRLPPLIVDARAHPVTAALPVTEYLGIGSYAGAPVRLPDGSLYGMLCCVSRRAHGALRDHHLHLLEALAVSLGHEMGDDAVRRSVPGSPVHRIARVLGGTGLGMVLQPIVRLATMQPEGAEALARFDVPPARPDVWFAEAVHLGLEVPLEMAAVNATLALLDRLPPQIYLSVNVSPATLCSSDLDAALARVDAGRVVVELTEHASVPEYDRLKDSVDRLRGRGARLAVDDAGAGFASFRHILSLRPDIIKFDRHMVRHLDVDPARQALVGALVAFAGEVNATLVAEGIEEPGQLDMLMRLGVGYGQGFLLARPGPLPLPEISVRPASLRREPPGTAPAYAPGAPGLEDAIRRILREVVDCTGLEASYVSIWDPRAETLEQRIVHDPRHIGIQQGATLPWRDTPCHRCRQAGILWTADVHKDLAGTALPAPDVRTFVSVPVLGAAGEMVATLCAAGRERRYLSDPVMEQVARLGSLVAGLLARAAAGVAEKGAEDRQPHA